MTRIVSTRQRRRWWWWALCIAATLVAVEVLVFLAYVRWSRPSRSVFRIPGVHQKFALGERVEFTIVGRREGEERYWDVAQRTRVELLGLESPDEVYWLRCTTGAEEIEFRFAREDSGERSEDGLYSPAIGEGWSLGQIRIETRIREDSQTRVKPSALRRGDRIRISDWQGGQLAYVTLRNDCTHFRMPIPLSRRFAYQLASRDSADRGGVFENLIPVPDELILMRTVLSPDISQYRVVDELTGNHLEDGRIVLGHDVITHEPLTIGFLPANAHVTYRSASIGSPEAQDGIVTLRPYDVPCPIHCIDGLNGKQLDDISVACSGDCVYAAHTRRLILPVPGISLNEVELVISSDGYRRERLPLSQVGQLLAHGQHLEIALRRTHQNVVVIWPASRGVAHVLGDLKFLVVPPFLKELERCLYETCAEHGYNEVNLLILKDDGLQDTGDLRQLAYTSADMPDAFFVGVNEWAWKYSVYRDENFKREFGAHTVVVAFLAQFNPPDIAEVWSRPVMHLHLAHLLREGEQDPYVGRFCEDAFDAVTNLTVGDVETMEDNARRLARDVADALQRHLVAQKSPDE